ncbi:MAG: disulfide bond formation protein B [Gammaproteobacteria bacterium]|nr:disulfide bond formation protein B [Gammaproteobacteria bacterium]
MFYKIINFTENKFYWLAWLVFAISLEASALFYQYVLDYLPCVLCIHVRVWVLGIIAVAIFALFFYKNWTARFISQLLMTVLSVGLFERSYQLLGIERGFVFGECNMESGLPAWFALDSWFPSVFKVWQACGYTPELLFGITMAEALIVLSFIMMLVSGILTAGMLILKMRSKKV